MQGVGAVVDSQLIVFAVQNELSLGNAVAVAADKGRAVRLWGVDDILNVVVTLNDVGYLTVFVGYHDCYNGTAIVGNCDFKAFAVLQDV